MIICKNMYNCIRKFDKKPLFVVFFSFFNKIFTVLMFIRKINCFE